MSKNPDKTDFPVSRLFVHKTLAPADEPGIIYPHISTGQAFFPERVYAQSSITDPSALTFSHYKKAMAFRVANDAFCRICVSDEVQYHLNYHRVSESGRLGIRLLEIHYQVTAVLAFLHLRRH